MGMKSDRWGWGDLGALVHPDLGEEEVVGEKEVEGRRHRWFKPLKTNPPSDKHASGMQYIGDKWNVNNVSIGILCSVNPTDFKFWQNCKHLDDNFWGGYVSLKKIRPKNCGVTASHGLLQLCGGGCHKTDFCSNIFFKIYAKHNVFQHHVLDFKSTNIIATETPEDVTLGRTIDLKKHKTTADYLNIHWTKRWAKKSLDLSYGYFPFVQHCDFKSCRESGPWAQARSGGWRCRRLSRPGPFLITPEGGGGQGSPLFPPPLWAKKTADWQAWFFWPSKHS